VVWAKAAMQAWKVWDQAAEIATSHAGRTTTTHCGTHASSPSPRDLDTPMKEDPIAPTPSASVGTQRPLAIATSTRSASLQVALAADRLRCSVVVVITEVG